MLRLAVALNAETTRRPLENSESDTAQQENTMTQTSATQAADKTTIRPFQVNVPEAELTELRRRINSTRWPDRETVTDESQGAPLATIQELARSGWIRASSATGDGNSDAHPSVGPMATKSADTSTNV